MDKRWLISGVGKIISPVLFYYWIKAFFRIVAESVFPGLSRPENSMWFLTVVNLAIFPVLYYVYQKDEKVHRRWKKNKPPVKLWDVLLVIVGAVCISRGANLCIGLTPLPYLFSGHEEVMGTIYRGSFLSQITASVISASMVEELLMRGLLYGRLRMVLGDIKVAVFTGAVIFGVFHGISCKVFMRLFWDCFLCSSTKDMENYGFLYWRIWWPMPLLFCWKSLPG